jgi:hypothetical protein
MKIKKYTETLRVCTYAIEINKSSKEAYYRRAKVFGVIFNC